MRRECPYQRCVDGCQGLHARGLFVSQFPVHGKDHLKFNPLRAGMTIERFVTIQAV